MRRKQVFSGVMSAEDAENDPTELMFTADHEHMKLTMELSQQYLDGYIPTPEDDTGLYECEKFLRKIITWSNYVITWPPIDDERVQGFARRLIPAVQNINFKFFDNIRNELQTENRVSVLLVLWSALARVYCVAYEPLWYKKYGDYRAYEDPKLKSLGIHMRKKPLFQFTLSDWHLTMMRLCERWKQLEFTPALAGYVDKLSYVAYMLMAREWPASRLDDLRYAEDVVRMDTVVDEEVLKRRSDLAQAREMQDAEGARALKKAKVEIKRDKIETEEKADGFVTFKRRSAAQGTKRLQADKEFREVDETQEKKKAKTDTAAAADNKPRGILKNARRKSPSPSLAYKSSSKSSSASGSASYSYSYSYSYSSSDEEREKDKPRERKRKQRAPKMRTVNKYFIQETANNLTTMRRDILTIRMFKKRIRITDSLRLASGFNRDHKEVETCLRALELYIDRYMAIATKVDWGQKVETRHFEERVDVGEREFIKMMDPDADEEPHAVLKQSRPEKWIDVVELVNRKLVDVWKDKKTPPVVRELCALTAFEYAFVSKVGQSFMDAFLLDIKKLDRRNDESPVIVEVFHHYRVLDGETLYSFNDVHHMLYYLLIRYMFGFNGAPKGIAITNLFTDVFPTMRRVLEDMKFSTDASATVGTQKNAKRKFGRFRLRKTKMQRVRVQFREEPVAVEVDVDEAPAVGAGQKRPRALPNAESEPEPEQIEAPSRKRKTQR